MTLTHLKVLTLGVALTVWSMGLPAIAQAETIDTRIGKLTFTHDFANGYPTEETVKKLYDERDFRRAKIKNRTGCRHQRNRSTC